MYNKFPKHEVDYLAKAQTIPASDTNADGNGGAFDLSGAGGGVEIVAQVNTAIGVPATKIFTVKLQHSDDGNSYTDLHTLYTVTAGATATSLAAGTVLGRYIVPNDAKIYIKANIVCNDTGFTGKVDIFPIQVPR
jgi:hypothetical protein